MRNSAIEIEIEIVKGAGRSGDGCGCTCTLWSLESAIRMNDGWSRWPGACGGNLERRFRSTAIPKWGRRPPQELAEC